MPRFLALLALLALLLPCLALATPPTVPQSMTFAGIEITFTPRGRASIQEHVNKLARHDTYVQSMARKAVSFMPHIEDAFQHMGVPDDLKYIVLQESALRGDAVSTSNAVGFWQFKIGTAQEVGLVVNNVVDERKHLTRASMGAARYFYQNNLNFNNWLYAVIAYMTGPAGAIQYVDQKYFGKTSMVIDESLHWYAQKVLAHKLIYSQAIEACGCSPQPILLAASNQGDTDLKDILKRFGITEQEFRHYNLWLKGNKLPGDRPYTVFIPREKSPLGHAPDPHLGLFRPPTGLPTTAVAQSRAQGQLPIPASTNHPRTQTQTTPPARTDRMAEDGTVYRDYRIEPWYEVDFVILEEDATLVELAQRYGKRAKDLSRYNGRIPTQRVLPAGSYVLLIKPKYASAHIARQGDTPGTVARRYGIRLKKLLEYNHLTDEATPFRPGQKVYLQYAAPSAEPLIIYQKPEPKPQPQQPEEPKPKEPMGGTTEELAPSARRPLVPEQSPAQPPEQAQPERQPEQKPAEQPQNSIPASPDFITYIVEKGDTLYSLARRYGLTVEQLRADNGMADNSLAIGQKLRIRVKAQAPGR